MDIDISKNMKDLFLKIYKERHNDFKRVMMQFADDDLHGPFLMSPSNKYPNQKNPLLIVGQETYGWALFVDDLNKQMEAYEEFNVGEKYYASPFWNVTRKLERALGNEEHSCAWTNMSKFDVAGGRAYGKFEAAISPLDNLLIDEIRILQPKVLVFFTGPKFDDRIKKIFNDVEFAELQGWEKRQLCQLKHTYLPQLTFRTYHPNYLRRSGLENEVLKRISKI